MDNDIVGVIMILAPIVAMVGYRFSLDVGGYGWRIAIERFTILFIVLLMALSFVGGLAIILVGDKY